MTSPAVPSIPAVPVSAGSQPAQPSSAAIKLDAAMSTALQLALAAEQAAVWAYDLVAAYDPADAAIIATIQVGHLSRRDSTAALLVSGGSTAPEAAAAYSIPNQVRDVASARALSTTVEGDCAAAWRGAIGSTDNPTLRVIALAGLSDSAVWLTTMQLTAKVLPATVPFPGVS